MPDVQAKTNDDPQRLDFGGLANPVNQAADRVRAKARELAQPVLADTAVNEQACQSLAEALVESAAKWARWPAAAEPTAD